MTRYQIDLSKVERKEPEPVVVKEPVKPSPVADKKPEGDSNMEETKDPAAPDSMKPKRGRPSK